MKKLTALLLALVLVFTMVGCSNQTEENVSPTPAPTMESAEANVSGPSVVGEAPKANEVPATSDSPVIATYTLVAASQGEETIAEGEFPAMQIVLREDGTGTYGVEPNIMQIMWSLEGNQYTLIAEAIGPEDPLILTADGDTLATTTGDLSMTFQKQ